MMRIVVVFVLFFIFSINCIAQISDPSVNIGLVYTNPELVSPGYTAIAPSDGSFAYLLDNCGKIVNQWTFSDTFNEACAYITHEGNCAILVSNGYGGAAVYGNSCIEVKSWENDFVWSYCPSGEYTGLHNDIYPLPNGNYLGIVQKVHTMNDAVENGFNPNNFGSDNSFRSESIVEFQPIGINDAEIVWEWNIWDHLVQDFDSTKLNYGVIADHPEKYDLNVETDTPASSQAFTHINSVEYDEENDFIVLSLFSIHEIFIIDHSTTMVEAAGDSGGNFGKGGSILYRWGNPQNYDRGDPNDNFILGQHDARWIPSGYVNEGKISIFNNDSGDDSEIVVIDPQFDSDGQFAKDPITGAYLPNEPFYIWRENIWNYPAPSPRWRSGVAPLQNGGFLMHDDQQGLIAEIAPNEEVVWVYQIPGDNINQGSGTETGAFKVRKYLPDYVGFNSQDLTAEGLIESDNIVSEFCSELNSNEGVNNAILYFIDVNQVQEGCEDEVSPILSIYNGGSNDITEMEVEFSVNGEAPTVNNWTGSIAQGETTIIDLNNISFIQLDENTIEINIISVNGTTDDAPSNNTFSSTWNSALSSEIGEYLFEVESDNYGYEIHMNIYDEVGNVVFAEGNFDNNTTFNTTFTIENIGCYEIEAVDDYGDGITNGGYMRITKPDGSILFQTPSSDYSLVTENFLALDTMQPAPVASFVALSLEPGLETTVEFTNNSTDATTFEWDFGDGNSSIEENPTNIYAESGDYEVCLYATNDTGTDTLCQPVIVTVLVSVNDLFLNEVQVFPNPVKNTISLKGNTEEIESYIITDAAGKLVESANFDNNQISAAALPKGVYILQLKSKSNQTKHHRFVKM